MLTQIDAQQRFGLSAHKGVRHLQQQTATVTGAPVCRNTAAVGHTGQRFNCCLQQAMTGLALNMSDQTKATIVPKFLGAVETSGGHRLTIDAARIYSMIHRLFRL